MIQHPETPTTQHPPAPDHQAKKPKKKKKGAGKGLFRGRSLAAVLMTTIIGFVTIMLIVVGLVSITVVNNNLNRGLDSQLITATQSIRLMPGHTAADILSNSYQPSGFLVVLYSPYTSVTGAIINRDRSISRLSEAQIEELAEVASSPDNHQNMFTAVITGHGEYRLTTGQTPAGQRVITGLPLDELRGAAASVITSIALITTVGLVLLAALIALIIRTALLPLRRTIRTTERVTQQPLGSAEVTISERVPVTESEVNSEAGKVAIAVNTMLEHVNASLTARARNEENMRHFVADASHELRTPLTAIRGYSELALRDKDLSEQVHASLDRIQAQSLRMSKLVDDLLLLARLDEGTELSFGTVNIAQLLIETTADASAAYPTHNWKLEIPEGEVTIVADAARIQQLVLNLLANAAMHTPEDSEVTVSLKAEPENVLIKVHDNGPGISEEFLTQIFERFARADASRARSSGGSGLGLAISYAIAQAHFGKLEVESEPGNTCFTIILPTTPVRNTEAQAASDA